jgi:hypothetical protein
MDPISRRNLLAASAAGGLLTAANAAAAQSGPQPQRPDRGGTDPGPRSGGVSQRQSCGTACRPRSGSRARPKKSPARTARPANCS